MGMDTPSPEFRLIQDYFADRQAIPATLSVPIGDDAAVLDWAGERQLVVCTDTLNAGIHFPDHAPASAIGWKALAVNLSDLAAMGAEARYFTLALSLPTADKDWLREFSTGLFSLANEHGVTLIGGDTTRGPLSITITALGAVSPGTAVGRDGAGPGDLIYVSGTLGDAAAALTLGAAPVDEHQQVLFERLYRPRPRLAWGQALAPLASAMIDISDGLAADLGHILARSGVGATVDVDRLPLSPALQAVVEPAAARRLALNGGDDYELCWTMPSAAAPALQQLARDSGMIMTEIGHTEPTPGLRLIDRTGQSIAIEQQGWDHFA